MKSACGAREKPVVQGGWGSRAVWLGLSLSLLLAGIGRDAAAQQERAAERSDQEIAVLRAAIQRAESVGDWSKSAELWTEVIKLDASATPIYLRGRARFCAGDIQGSVEDFDRYYDQLPGVRSRQWERGIALYYAGKFKEGAEQFKLYQTYHDADVENGVWKYLCEARLVGPEEARKNLLDIGNDTRVPMRKLYDLYEGKTSVDDVFQVVEEAELGEQAESRALFYAHLYVGLWLEAQERADDAREHLRLAAEKYPIDHYMGEVAKVHWELVKKREQDKQREQDQERDATGDGKSPLP